MIHDDQDNSEELIGILPRKKRHQWNDDKWKLLASNYEQQVQKIL